MKLFGNEIGKGKTLICVEIGICHQGNMSMAIEMIDIAKECGADVVKFQKRSLKHLYRKPVLDNPSDAAYSLGVYIPILEKCELTEDEHIRLKKHCDEIGIPYFCSPWDTPSIDFLESLGVEAYKVPSALMSDIFHLERIIKTGKPFILSTGMHYEDEIDEIMKFIDEKAEAENVPRGVPHKQIIELTDEILSMRKRGTPKSTDVSRMPSELYAMVEKIQSLDKRTEIQNELSILYARLCEAGNNPEESMRILWGSQCTGSPYRLQQTTESSMALQDPPSFTPSIPLKQRIALMHCVSSYPTANKDINLNYMGVMRAKYGLPVGFSGHERGIPITVAAVALGAPIIERHFTLDRTLPGPDHAASLEPHGLETLVRHIRAVEEALGDRKVVNRGEYMARETLGKILTWAQDLESNSTVGAHSFTASSPGYGVPVYKGPKFVDMQLVTTKPVRAGEPVFETELTYGKKGENE